MERITHSRKTNIQVSRPLDRTHLLPAHTGPNVLPASPFFGKLLRHAHRKRIAVRDLNLGVEKTYGDALADALSLRMVLENTLDCSVLDRLAQGDEIYIGVLAAGGYEFTVAMLAVLAIGAAAVPMTVANPTGEAAYFVTKSRQVALISSSEASDLALTVVKHVKQHENITVPHLTVLPNLPPTPIFSPEEIVISSNQYLNDNSPGIVIFTSGTTGRPKGAVMRRAYIHETALAIAEGYDIEPTDVLLHVLPVHHATGIGTSFFPFLVSGACIEFRSGSFDPAGIWNRLRDGGITIFSGVPTIFMRLMWFYRETLSKLPDNERVAYVQAAQNLRSLLCGSSALQQPVQEFWTKMRGLPILVRYGSSEIPNCLKMSAGMDFTKVPKGCVGTAVPGVETKLTEGNQGELLVRSPYIFSKYLFDEEATIDAHDGDGFFKTGDICRRDGPYYFIIGRASVDIIKSGGYKISASDIEKDCLELPYVAEAVVVGVEDEEFGQRVGAIITLKPDYASSSKWQQPRLTIDELRTDLRKRLPGYKLPTLLRIVEGELPKGPTGKLQKKLLGPNYFPCPGWKDDKNVQKWVRPQPQVLARL